MNLTQMSGLTSPTTPRRPAAEPMQFSLAAAVEPKPIRFSAGTSLADTVRSQRVPANGKMVVEGFGAMLPLNEPNLRAGAQKSLAELQAVMKEKGINEVVLRVPRGAEEQVVTQTDITTRSTSGNAAPPADQGRPTPNPTPTPPRGAPVTGGSTAPRDFPVQNGVMAIKLGLGDNQLDVLKQAVTQAPKGTRIEIEGMNATLRTDNPNFGSQNADKLREMQALIAPKDLTVVLRDAHFPATMQTVTKDKVETAMVQGPAAAIKPTPHPNWPDGFWTNMPSDVSIAASYQKLIEEAPGYRGSTFILEGTFGPSSNPSRFHEVLASSGTHGDSAQDELTRLTALAQQHDLTIVLPNHVFGKMSHTLAITKNGLESIPLPSTMPTVR